MKLIVLFAVIAVACAQPVFQIAEVDGKAPADTVHAKHVEAKVVAPVVAYSAPVAYHHAPLAYHAPVVYAAPTVVQGNPPLLKSQYVAAPVEVKTVKVEAPVVKTVAAPFVAAHYAYPYAAYHAAPVVHASKYHIVY